MLRISAKTAARIDEELLSSGGFSIDQLMELAGLSVAQALYRLRPPVNAPKVLVLVGPGNNGGDGLVASRHLHLLGYKLSVYCPKESKQDIFKRLLVQLSELEIPRVDSQSGLTSAFESADYIIDSLFGFSFKPPVRESFLPVMNMLSATKKPVLSVDIPSGWDVDAGPGDSKFHPTALISLTAPKTAAEHFRGRHFIGGRFVDNKLAQKYGFQVPPYDGLDQIYEEA